MNQPRDKGNWAKPTEALEVHEVEGDALNLNVEGRKLTGPLQGFGQLWQKTYRIPVADKTPEEIISIWKAEYGRFWPDGHRFYAPITGIRPGEVGLINAKSGPTKLSTGVMVLYADDTSFTFMTPQGHPFAGWITFSAFEEEGTTYAQIYLLIRPNDPIYEVAFLTFGSRAEDQMWQHTLRELAAYLGTPGAVATEIVRVDRKRQWKNFGNIRHNSVARTSLRKPIWRTPPD